MKTLHKTNQYNEITTLLSFPIPVNYTGSGYGDFCYTTKSNLITLLDHLFDPDGWENLCSNGQIIGKDLAPSKNGSNNLIVTAQAEANVIIHYKEEYLSDKLNKNNPKPMESMLNKTKIFRSAIGSDQSIKSADNQGGASAIEDAIKNAETNAFKRACAKFGTHLGGKLGSSNKIDIKRNQDFHAQQPNDNFQQRCREINSEIDTLIKSNKTSDREWADYKLKIINEFKGFGNTHGEYRWIRRLLDKCS